MTATQGSSATVTDLATAGPGAAALGRGDTARDDHNLAACLAELHDQARAPVERLDGGRRNRAELSGPEQNAPPPLMHPLIFLCF